MAKSKDYHPCVVEEHVFYKDRQEWKDITPLSQNDGPNPVVKIAYTDAFEDVYDYFRAIVHKGELSERALLLTEDAIHMNAANYTVWQYRRKVLKHIDAALHAELDFCRDMIEMNPKNYQVWHHRRVIVEWLNDPSKELLLTKIVFGSDSKNYHAWEHRQWVLQTYNLFDEELEFIDELLLEDVRNNSAWNQRYFVVTNTTGYTEDVLNREIIYTQKAINSLVNNESPWNYLRGILKHAQEHFSNMKSLTNWIETLLVEEEGCCPFLLAFQLDILKDKLELSGNLEHLTEYSKLCHDLATKYDVIRQQYWKYMDNKIVKKYEHCNNK